MIPIALSILLVQGGPSLGVEVKVSSPQPLQYGAFGRVVALDGDTAWLGDGYTAPSLRQFTRSGASWTYTATTPQLPSSFDVSAVDVDGPWMIAGAAYYGLGGGAIAFRRTGTSWQPFQWLDLPHTPPFDEYYGWSVDLDGERVAIGNPLDGQFGTGVVYVWQYSHALAKWRIRAVISGPTNTPGRGAGVALKGDDLLVASRSDVQHYRYDTTTESWFHQGTVISGLGGVGVPVRHPLAISGQGVAVVGDPYDDTQGSDAGAAYVLEKHGLTWAPRATLHSATPAANARFGRAVAARGPLVAVGAANEYFYETHTAGSVELFLRNEGWRSGAVVTASDAALGDAFGRAVALEPTAAPLRTTLLVGACFDDDVAPQSGSAYFYEVSQDAAVYCTSKVNSQDCVPRTGFSGSPSATSAAPFTIVASSVINQRNGVFFYGTSGASAAPFQGGFKCVRSPTRRTGVLFSNGSAPPSIDCSGTFGLDFNARIRSGVDASLVAGASVHGQFWYRDLASSFGTGLTEALEFVIAP